MTDSASEGVNLADTNLSLLAVASPLVRFVTRGAFIDRRISAFLYSSIRHAAW